MSKQRFCVFCGGPGITREHMWPEWLQAYCGDMSEDFHTNTYASNELLDDGVAIDERAVTRQGKLMNKTYPVVCVDCNGGWMSDLEQRAKPLLVPLIRGVPKPLSRDDQRTVATWVVKTVFMFEFNDHKTISATFEQRKHLRDRGEPPPLSRVWMGRHIGSEWSARFRHAGIRLLATKGGGAVGDDIPVNSQTTAFGCGQLFFYVATTTVDEFAQLALPSFLNGLLSPIWPVVRAPVRFPADTVTDERAGAIAMALLAVGHIAMERTLGRRIPIVRSE